MGTKKSHIERRKHRRVKANFLFSYQIAKPVTLRMIIGRDSEVNALMLDLSEGGVALITEYNIPPFAILFMKFVLIGHDGSGEKQVGTMEAIGEVRYNLIIKNKKNDEHRLGISFMYVSDKNKEMIASFVDFKS